MHRHQLRRRLSRTLVDSDFALAHHVVFLPRLAREQFAALLSTATVALDTFPFGGGVTTLETLAHGTPVLTLPSKQSVPQLGQLRQGPVPLVIMIASLLTPARTKYLPSPPSFSPLVERANAAAGMMRRMDAASNSTLLTQSLVARDVAHFVSLAVRLGIDQKLLKRVGAAIVSGSDILFEAKESVEAWSRFLERV